MDRTYVITPEMLGLTWRHLCRMAMVRSIAYFLVVALLLVLFKVGWTVSLSAAVAGSIMDFALTFTVRFHAPRGLRVTDDSIEEVDGPVILKNEIVELIDRDPRGLVIVGRRSVSWLPKYRIFVPALLPEFNEVRQLVCSWR